MRPDPAAAGPPDDVVVARGLTKVYGGSGRPAPVATGAGPRVPGRGAPAPTAAVAGGPGGSRPGAWGIPGGVRTADGGLLAVDGLDLSVHRGEIFGLLGPNGAGKTTTIGILTTRVLPTAGQALVGGVDVVAHPARAKRAIGVVSQVNTLDRSLSVRDNLYFHGRYFGLSRTESSRRADELLERFRLADRARASVMAMSGGMAQRLMVARAILHRPEVLFLDEPTAGLDPQSRLALWDLVRELHAAGQTVVLTTHYMEEAEQLCERLAIMDRGRVLALGTPAQLTRTHGGTSEIRVEVGSGADELASALRSELGDQAVAVTAAAGVVHCAVHRAGGLLAPAVQVAERLGLPVANVSVAEPTLESVFINLTGRDLRE